MPFPFRLLPSLRLFTTTACIGLFTACGTGGTTVLVPVAGGSGNERVRVEFTHNGPAHAKADGFEVMFAGFIYNTAPKAPDFSFDLAVENGKAPRRVHVQDITEEPILVFLTDESPALTAGHWRGLISGLDPHDPRIEWLHRMNNDIRIFRFTIVTAEGKTVVLDQATSFPTFIKAAIRMGFGEKPQP